MGAHVPDVGRGAVEVGMVEVKLVRIGRRYLVPIPALLELLTGER